MSAMIGDQDNRIQAEANPNPQPVSPDGPTTQGESTDVALWKPSLTALLLSGSFAGAILGVVDGVLFQVIAGGFITFQAACLWGAGLGIAGGVALVLIRRAIWGPDLSAAVGTLLGLLYGIAPGVAVLYQSFFVIRVVSTSPLVGLVMACSMAGLIVGAVLDRITDAIIARFKRFQA
jgi:hypothetical protein